VNCSFEAGVNVLRFMRVTKVKIGAISALVVAAVSVGVWREIRVRQLAAENSQLWTKPGAGVPGVSPLPEQPRTITTSTILAAALAKPFDWRLVESEDYRKYIANLRAIGCPEETIRDIITADIGKLFASRAKALRASAKKYEYCRSWEKAEPYDEETMQKLGELAKQKQAMFKELLGVDVPSDLDKMVKSDPLERTMSFLTPEKLQQVADIRNDKDRWQRSEEARKNNNREELWRIRAEREAALKQALTPEEKFEYDLREAAPAGLLRDSFGSFEPTEQEFRDMFRAWQKYDEDERADRAAMGTAGYEARLGAGERELRAQLRQSLGEERYREYAFEREWLSAADMASQFDISKERYRQVFEYKMAAQDQAEKLRVAPSLTPAQRQAALDAIRTETEGAIGGVLGQDLLPGYLRVAPWIRELNKPRN